MRAIVFDFDGVLADSEPLHLASLQEVLSALGVTLTREEYYAKFLGYSDEEVFRRMAARHRWALGGEQLAALVAQKSAVFNEAHATGAMMYPEAPECIERLAKFFPLGIASGALRHEIEEALAGAGLAHHFRFIVAAGDTPNSKPSPDPYRRAAALHGLPPSACVAIEDSRWGIQSAKTAGLRCVGIANTYPAHELSDADAVIGSLAEFTEDLIREL